MCITIGETEAKLTGTKIYVGEAIRDGKLVHVLAYQNIADSDAGIPNAMIIPFPTNKPMWSENIIDTSKFSGFLKDIADATKKRPKRSRGYHEDSFAMCAGNSRAQVFESGSYTVILASHAAQIPEALTSVPEYKRPKVSTRFLIQFGMMYPGQPIALCCWSGYVDAEPLLWWYEPSDEENLFIPTMDAHDGGPPKLDAVVTTDHIISVGSRLMDTGSKITYMSAIPKEIEAILPIRVHGYKVPIMIKNGDMFVNVRDVRNNSPFIKRGKSVTDTHSSELMNGWIS